MSDSEPTATNEGLRSSSCSRLVKLCESMIAILDTVEESDSGRIFNPTQITSCRAYDLAKIGDILNEIKSICENASVEASPTKDDE